MSTWYFVQICAFVVSLYRFFSKNVIDSPECGTSHWVVYLESSFANVESDLLIYLTLMVTNCS